MTYLQYTQRDLDDAARAATVPLAADIADVRTILTEALGGPGSIPADATITDLANALASMSGGYRNGLEASGRVCATLADKLDEAAMADMPRRLVLTDDVRRTLRRHATTPVDAR